MISSPIIQKRTSTPPFTCGEYGILKRDPKAFWPFGRAPMLLPRRTSVNDWLWVRAAVAYDLFCGDSVQLMDDGLIEIEFTATATKPC